MTGGGRGRGGGIQMSEITLRNLISTFSFSLVAKGHVFLLLFSPL